MLPRNLRRTLKHASPSIEASALLTELARVEPAVALDWLGGSVKGLSEEEVTRRLERHGLNVVASDVRRRAHAVGRPSQHIHKS